jgi:hypothetical protein
MKAISTINLMPSTNNEVDKMFTLIKQEILSGKENPLKLEVQLKAMETLIKKLRSDNEIKEQMIDEGMKYPEKSFELFGAKFIKTTVGVKYDFSACRDSEYDDLKVKFDNLKAKLKEKEDFLKSLKQQVANPDTGEIIYPAKKTGKESISVKLL